MTSNKRGAARELVRKEEVQANSNGSTGSGERQYAEMMMQLARAAEKVEGQISKRLALFDLWFRD